MLAAEIKINEKEKKSCSFRSDVTHNTGDRLRCASNAFKVTSFDVNWNLCSPVHFRMGSKE